jgi:hypothetical protein
MHVSSWKNITYLQDKETLAFNLTKVGSFYETVKNFLNSRLFFNMHIVLCVYVQWIIGSGKGTIIDPSKTLISLDI